MTEDVFARFVIFEARHELMGMSLTEISSYPITSWRQQKVELGIHVSPEFDL